jgi:hypothetical protein
MLILKEDLLRLVELASVDSVSVRIFSDEIYLHSGKHVGLYVSGHGVVLHPVYTLIQRFDDLLKVGRETDQVILFGCYSINEQKFLIEPTLSENEFWTQFKLLKQKSNA